MGFVTVDLNNINVDDNSFDEDDLKTIVHVRLMVLYNRFKRRKGVKLEKEWKKIDRELMPMNFKCEIQQECGIGVW